MTIIECLDTGLIYRNPKPYLRSLHAYFPSVVVLSDNEMLATLVFGSAFESVDCHVYVARSKDTGKTWPEYVNVMDNYTNHIVYWEQKIIELEEERLLSIAWAFDEAKGKDLANQYTISEDGGRHFQKPQSTELMGQTLAPIRLKDGRILSVYRRMDKTGLWANVSHLENDRWTNEAESPLWGAQTSALLKRGPTKDMAAYFNVLKFGAPCASILPNGEVFVAFWCVEDCVSNIRWFRLKIR